MYLLTPENPVHFHKSDPNRWAAYIDSNDLIYPELIKDFELDRIIENKPCMFHLVYNTVHTSNGYDQFAVVSLNIPENDETADLISKNPLFLEKWYDSESTGLYCFYLKLPEKYQDKNYAVNRNTELENKHD